MTQSKFKDPTPGGQPFTPELIPDEREFKEQAIDRKLAWVCQNDPTSPQKNFEMVERDHEIHFFQERRSTLERERDGHVHQLLFRHKQTLNALESSDPVVSPIGPSHLVKERQNQWLDGEKAKLEEAHKQEISACIGRYNAVIRQCEDRIDHAKARLEVAYQHWEKSYQGHNLQQPLDGTSSG